MCKNVTVQARDQNDCELRLALNHTIHVCISSSTFLVTCIIVYSNIMLASL